MNLTALESWLHLTLTFSGEIEDDPSAYAECRQQTDPFKNVY
jgi:2'-5' RNA ligase